jgi:exodeoxyribonuclease V alpha subunit
MRMAVAKDRTKVEHVALVREVKFPRPNQPQDGGWVILELTDGYTAHGAAQPTNFSPGIQYRFMGRWKNDPRWGDQFHFTSFTVHGFSGRAGVVNYLAKTCEGIGEKSAEKLWTAYGTQAVELLRTDPARFVADGLLREDVARAASEDLEREKHLEYTRIELHELLHGRGFHGKLLNQAISKWGAKAPTVIRRDPFKLLGLAGAGYKRCDKLWRELGLPLDSLKRQLYAALNEISNDRDGHTWIGADRARDCLIAAVGYECAKPKRALKLGIRAGKLAARRDADGAIWVSLSHRAEAERRIADGIKRLCLAADSMFEGGILWPDEIPVTQVEGDGLPSAHQAAELRRAFLAQVGCFTGGPGTGKTHSLAFALRQIVQQYGVTSVAVAAPTGKAAVRATQALKAAELPIRATTIHQLLEIGRNGHDGGGWGFLRNRDCPLDEQFLVIDESSMIDASLMADVFDACADGTHLLFVGDPYQLAPVGHGAPLRDIIAAQVPTGELTEVRRNAGRIVLACRDIKAGRPVEFSPRIDLAAEQPENLKLLECPATQTADTVVKLLSHGVLNFHPVWQTQVIVALNEKGACSRTDLNDRLQKLLNPDGRSHPKCRFRVGDKVICLKNTWLRVCVPVCGGLGEEGEADANSYRDLSADTQVYCANGEIGRVVAVGEKSFVARMGESDHLLRVGTGKKGGDDDAAGDQGGEKEGAASDFDLGFVVSGHKMQGSQAPCVVICADEAAGMVAAREWWYTSLSRASKLCVVVGPGATVQKQAAKQTLIRRKTFLAEAIRESRTLTEQPHE